MKQSVDDNRNTKIDGWEKTIQRKQETKYEQMNMTIRRKANIEKLA